MAGHYWSHNGPQPVPSDARNDVIIIVIVIIVITVLVIIIILITTTFTEYANCTCLPGGSCASYQSNSVVGIYETNIFLALCCFLLLFSLSQPIRLHLLNLAWQHSWTLDIKELGLVIIRMINRTPFVIKDVDNVTDYNIC